MSTTETASEKLLMSDSATASRSKEKGRFHLALTQDRMARARDLADKHGSTLTEIFRFSLIVMEKVEEEVSKGNKIAVIDRDGNLLREIVFPFS